MAKRLLLNVLVNVLGEFIEVDENNLSLAVWSGSITLTNVKLKTDNLIKKYNFVIYHGSVKTLEINIPWASLLTSPLKIKLDGILLDVGPIDITTLNPSERLKRILEEKMQSLKMLDQYLEISQSVQESRDQNTNSESFVQQWTSRVIDNIELSLSNVHLRFEDPLSVKDKVVAVGVTLESFVITTCDDQWQPAYITNSSVSGKEPYINKLATIQSLGIYWQVNSTPLSAMSYSDWSKMMLDLIHKKDKKLPDLHYILRPIQNNMFMKLTHYKKAKEGHIRFDIRAESNDLQVNLDNTQFNQIFSLTQTLSALHKKQFIPSYQPSERPLHFYAVVEWWKYSYRLIKLRPKYVRLVKLTKRAQQEGVSNDVLMSQQDIKEMQRIETILPLEVLKAFKKQAYCEILEETRKERNRESRKESTNGGWWGWLGAAGSEDHDENDSDIAINTILDEFQDQIDPGQSSPSSSKHSLLSSFKVSFSSSSVITLSNNHLPIIECKSAVNFILQPNSEGFNVICNLTDINVQEVMGITSFHPQIVSVKRELYNLKQDSKLNYTLQEIPPTLSIVVEKRSKDTRVSINALPVEIFVNKLAIHALLLSFQIPKKQVNEQQHHHHHSHKYTNTNNIPFISNTPISSSKRSDSSDISGKSLSEDIDNRKLLADSFLSVTQDTRRLSSKFIQNLMTENDKEKDKNSLDNAEDKPHLYINCQLHAPKIIIPEDCTKDAGYLLLDCGVLKVNGYLNSNGISFNIGLNSVNAGLPLYIHDLYSFGDLSLYLIKPFDFNMLVQSIDKSMADLTAQIKIEPEIRGEIDPSKLARLLRIVNSSTDIMSPKEDSKDYLNKLAQQHYAYQYIDKYFELSSEKETNKSIHPIQKSEFNTPVKGKDEESFHTPNTIPFSPVDRNEFTLDSSRSQSPLPKRISELEGMKKRMSSSRDNKVSPLVEVNPNHVNMRITVVIPILALDLTYDSTNNHHLIFAIESLSLKMTSRPYDRHITFDLSDLSIQDSFRCLEQKYLAWTPKDSGDLIHITHLSISDERSPSYSTHSSEITMKFAKLGLNLDVNTMLHLKPFFEVLLDKRPKQVNYTKDPTSSNTTTSNTFSSQSLSPVKSNQQSNSSALKGMKVNVTLEMISLDLLRTYNTMDKPGQKLDTAFSIEFSGMRVDIDMMDLMKSVLRLRSFNIIDIRDISKDYIFRQLFCPTIIAEKTNYFPSSSSIFPQKDEPKPSKIIVDPMDADIDSSDLLHLIYTQELKNQTFFRVFISGVSSFVSIDTILDFATIAMANFFAFTSLFSSPDPQAQDPVQILSIENSKETNSETLVFTKSSTMNATVKMVNSRLILLEDPTMKESRAIVGQCVLEMHYTRELKENPSISLIHNFESVHVSISDNEMFVIKNMMHWNPSPILEPFDVECHFKRRRQNDETLYSSVQMELDNIEAKLSFNDLLLAHAILARRKLAVEDPQQMNSPVNNRSPLQRRQSIDGNNIVTPTPSLMVRFGMNELMVTIINDFTLIPVPVVKLTMDTVNFFAEGMVNDLKGEGSAHIKIDYFNSPILIWEPLLDSWRPSLKVYSEEKVNILEVRSDHTLQLSLSGSMLETLLKSYSMFFHDYDLQLDRYNFNTSDMFIINNLGDEIDIDIYDSSSKAFLQEVRANEKAVVHTIKDNNKKIWARSFHMPNSIDVILKGPLKDQRQPLCFLPFNINKPKAYILPSQLPPLQVSPSSDPSKFDTNNLVVEPIEEEIYENSRYDPILRLWRTPYFMGDPYQWTDGSCQVRKDMDSISVLSDQWEWVGRWEVDMDGVVNKDIDSDGWEYATSFNFFSMVSPRRAYNSMDLVRRRRWTRTRIPKRINNDYIHRPLTIFWDVKTSSDGSRAVEIRSSFQIKNELGYPLMISLNHRSWSEDFVIGPIAIGETISVSLLHSFASLIKFKPQGDHYDWSEYYPCHNHSYDFRNMKEAQCTFLGNNLIPEEKKSFRNEGEDDSFNVYFHIWTISENKSILIKLTPYYMIHNNMLCHFVYKCISVDSSNSSDGIIESSMIQSGQISTIRQMNIQRVTYLSIQVGTYDWSSPLILSKITKDSTEILEMIHSDNEKDKLPLCLYCYYDIDRVLHVEIYFKVAIVDKSNLHLLVSTNYISNSEAPSPATKDNSSRRKTPTTITKGFQILDQSLLDISLDNLLTVSASRHQEYTLTKNASSSPNHLGSTSLDSSILKSPLIEDIQTTSDHIIDFVKCDLGNNVYSDSKYKWSHLPFYLQKRMSLRLAHADRVSRSPNFLKFTSKKLLIVCVLMHIQANNKFLVQEGYQKLTEIAIAKRIVNKKLIEVHYQILGKILYPGDEVVLRGPWDSTSLNENSCSYSITLIPIEDLYKELQVPEDTNNYNRRQLLEQLLFQNKFSLEFAGLCWTESCHDITAFYTEDNLIQVRPQSEDSWSDKIDIDTRKNSTTKDSFDVHCPRSGLIYHLSYTIENLPGLYHRTQVVTFMPRYCILNCMEESVFISQRGSNKHIEFLPYVAEGWHNVDSNFDTEVRLRTSSTVWSLGSININEIGTTVLYIPYSDEEIISAQGSKGLVLHVEVKLAEPLDNCSIIVIIWQETVESQATMWINNDTDVHITLRQSDLELDHDLGNKDSLYEITIPPKRNLPFGWADPESGTNIHVAVGTSLASANKRIATLNMLKDGQRLRLPYNQSSAKLTALDEVILTISTSDAGHVLHISRSSTSMLLEMETEKESGSIEALKQDLTLDSSSTFPLLGVNILLSSFGISLIVEKPKRRELFSLYIDNMEILMKSKGTIKTLEFSIMDLQLDNYSETAIYPVLLRSKKKEIHKSVTNLDDDYEVEETESSGSMNDPKNAKEKPLIQLSVFQDQPIGSPRPIYKYIGLRILSLAVEVDSATMQILFLDLLDDLKILTSSQYLAITRPKEWLTQYNYNLLYPHASLIDVYFTKQAIQQNKIYIKSLIIHPMKVTLTFYLTTFPRREKRETLQSTVLNAFMSLVGLDKLQLRLNSFEVEDAMESYLTLTSLIMTKTIQDVRSQLGQIAGSLALIGSPIGFARKVGSGVKAFFYEPYYGIIHESNDLLSGLKKGTQRLITGVVGGAMDSTVAFIGTASKSISYLSGDIDYVRKRAIKRQQNFASRGGVYAGIRDGGESILSGITSGVTGLVSKPFEEASKTGIQGFFKGIGLGVLGAAVKPLVGLTEGVASIAYGISTTVDPNSQINHVRPSRALEPSTIDPSILTIVPLNLDASFSQDFITQRAKQNGYDDSFLSYISLDNQRNDSVILSNVYVFWRRGKSLWGRIWANISHCIYLGDAIGIILYSGTVKGNMELVIIPCSNKSVVKRLYTNLAMNAFRMGNPSKVYPIDFVPWDLFDQVRQKFPSSSDLTSLTPSSGDSTPLSEKTNEQLQKKKQFYMNLIRETGLLGDIDGYCFGSVNGQIVPLIKGSVSEADLLATTQQAIEQQTHSWKEMDEILWNFISLWNHVHVNLASCRVCMTLIANCSESPVQLCRVQMLLGRSVTILGSKNTRYDSESRLIYPKGYIVLIICAFPQSPLEIGHLKCVLNMSAFNAMFASTQRETSCDPKAGNTVGFLEKTYHEWWSKLVIKIS